MSDFVQSKPPSLGGRAYTPDPPNGVPVATGGKVQPRSPKKIKVKAHTRVVQNRPAPSAPAPGLDPATRSLLDAAVRMRFGGQEQAINQQLGSNARFSSGVPAWYSQAINEIKGIGATGAAQNAQTLQNVQAYNSPVAQTGSPDAQQAADARNNLNSQYATMLGRDSQANQDFLGRMQAGMQTQQGNTLNQSNRERQVLLGQRGQLAGQKGDFRTTEMSNIRAATQKALLDQQKNNLAAQALGLKVDTLNKVQIPLAQSLSQDRVAGQKVARSGLRETKNQHAIGNQLAVNKLALDAYKAAHPNAGKGAGSNSTYSTSKVQGFRANWDYAKATAFQLKDKGTYKDKQSGANKPITSDVAYGALLGATKDPDLARAASLIAFKKPVPADLRHRLALKGVHLPKESKQKNIGQIFQGALQRLGS